jgi:LPS-assembly lipoprotein
MASSPHTWRQMRDTLGTHIVMLAHACIHFVASCLARASALRVAYGERSARRRLPPSSSRLSAVAASRLPATGGYRLPLVVLLCLALAACGFQLRGVADFPFDTLYLDAPVDSPFATQLRRVIGAGNRTRITLDPAEADATLQLLYELREREILSLSPEGRVREFQLRYRVAYQVLDRGKQVVAPRAEIVLRRDYAFRDEEHLAREAEEVLLYRDMQNDAVHQLVRRLQAVKLAARS